MSYRDFEYAFVHRFGRHGGEEGHEIIMRKKEEIESEGWTLWAFQHRPGFEEAHRRLSGGKFNGVYAFCTWGATSADPDGNKDNETLDCTHYRMIGTESWERLPTGIRSSQPFKIGSRKRFASAFVVRRIIYPVHFASTVEWLGSEGEWRQTRKNGDKNLPTHGEYLVRCKKRGAPLRNIRMVLDLKPPYLAYLKVV